MNQRKFEFPHDQSMIQYMFQSKTHAFSSNINNRLLTLTSFPFRITYCNGAFTTLCGNKTSPIGDQIFDVFEVEGRTLKPSLARYPTLDGYFDNEVVLVPFLNEKGQSWRRCKIQVYPVYKRSNPNELRFFAVTFMPL